MPAIDLSAIYNALDKQGRATMPQEARKDYLNSEGRGKEHNKHIGITSPLKDKVYYSLEKEQEQRVKTAQIYADYQKNIRASGQLITEITKGVLSGAQPMNLLLKAIEAIGLMVGDPQLYIQSKKDLQTIYGALGDETMLSLDLQETTARREKLEAAYKEKQAPDNAERIKRAILMHKEAEKLLSVKLKATAGLN